MKRIDPDYVGQHVCEQCSEHVDLNHVMCGCASSDAYAKNKDHWDKVLKSASLHDQLRAVQEARAAAESFGLSVADVGASLYSWRLAECPSGPLLWDIKFYRHHHGEVSQLHGVD
ncbi:hypothetical protein V5799_034488 [Amblyomma americanum]|uniref:Uncharacterized protein n=1 Tax=Amblyomma americanum TaxID=6943 RepID=A0AAQ4DKB1_AMBAM